MAQTLQQDIRVTIDNVIRNLPQLRAYAQVFEKIADSKANVKVDTSGVQGAATEVQSVSAAVDRLTSAVDALTEKTPGKLQNFFRTLGSVAQVLTNLGTAVDFVEKRGGQLVGLFRDKAGPAFDGLKDKAQTFAVALGAQGGQAVGALGGALRGIIAPIGSAIASLGGLGAAALGVGAVIVGLVAGLALLAAGFTALIGSIGGLAAALVAVTAVGLTPLLAAGLAYNSQMEQTKIGIAAIIASLGELRDANGRVLEGTEALTAALALADDQLQKLKVDAINTTATFGEIAPAFQQAIGPGLAAGLNLDEIRRITVNIVQAASAIGLPAHQIAQEVRAILEGSININARLANTLLITGKMVKDWKDQNVLAQELRNRLGQFDGAGQLAAKSLSGLTSNLKEALEVFQGFATVRAFDRVKEQLSGLLDRIFDFKNAGLQKEFLDLANAIDDLFVRGINLAGDLANRVVSGLIRIGQFISQHQNDIDDILDSVEEIARILFDYLAIIVKIVARLLTSRATIDLIKNSLSFTAGLLELILATVVALVQGFAGVVRYITNQLNPALTTTLAIASRIAQAIGLGQKVGDPDLSGDDIFRPSGKFILAQLFKRTTDEEEKKPSGAKGRTSSNEPADTFDSLLQLEKAQAEAAFNLLRDALDRQLKLIQDNFEERKVSIRDFYAEQERLQTAAIDAEIRKLTTLRRAEERRLANETAKIRSDSSLSTAEKEAKLTIATNQAQAELVSLNEQLIIRYRSRAEIADRAGKDELAATRALQDELQHVIDEIDRARGLGPLVQTREEISRLTLQMQELELNGQKAAANVIREWIKFIGVMGQVNGAVNKFYRDQEVNEARIATLREQGRRNLLQQFLSERQINQIRKEQITAAEQLLKKLEEVARKQSDPAIEAALERQRTAVAALKNEYTTLGQTIKDTFIDSAVHGIERFLLSLNQVAAGTKTLGDAFREMALGIIEEIQRIIVRMIAMKIVMAAINIFSGGSAAGADGGGAAGFALPGAFAAGDLVRAHPGGRIIRVAEAGHDELVVSTDPSLASRTAKLLGSFIERTGILPDFSSLSSSSILSQINSRLPSFGAGDWVSASGPQPAFAAPGIGPLKLTTNLVFPNVRDARGFTLNQQTMLREAGRGIERGLKNARGSRD